MKYYRELYTCRRLYLVVVAIIGGFILGQFLGFFYLLSEIVLLVFVFFLAVDFVLLFFSGRQPVDLYRTLPEKLSNGDENMIYIRVKNNHAIHLKVEVIDEVPFQFQQRATAFRFEIDPGKEHIVEYGLTPYQRGEYKFGVTHVYFSGIIGLLRRRLKFGPTETLVPVYPSFLQMKKYEFLAVSDYLTDAGIKRVRRPGLYSEFDQIKDYVVGDNYRTINWKATARRSKLMVNQYQEERSQQIFNVIDKGRAMQMPFGGMSLLDYSINSTLILSNIALKKYDKAGLLTFTRNVDTFFNAERGNKTIGKIQELLYMQQTEHFEPDYAIVSAYIRRNIRHRSLLIFYTNFETLTSLQRQLPFFRNIAQYHLLLIVIFENSEIKAFARQQAFNLQEVYAKTIAEKFVYEKKMIVRELQKNGILAILTKPENLSVNVINKYLELKRIGRI